MKRNSLSLLFLSLLVAGAFLFQQVSRASGTSGKELTFSKDIAPIFFKNCAECHRPGEGSPFSVLSYKDVRPWAKSIREKVARKTMPPWHADPHFSEWANDRRLAQTEIDAVVSWVDGGAKEGNPKDLPPAPKFISGWTIGQPDVVIPMSETFTLEASGPDEYQYFTVDPGFKEDVYVQSAEARPDNRKIVHHIIAFIQPPSSKPRPDLSKFSKEELEKLRAKMEKESPTYREGFLVRTKQDAPVVDDGCAAASGGKLARADRGQDMENGQLLAGYAPGMNQAMWETGTVKRIPAGSKIVFQMHYSKVAGTVQKDRSSIGLIFAKTPPEKLVRTFGISNNAFLIPAGAENHRVTACWSAKEDIHIINFMPHMHLRGKAVEYKAFYPDGKSEVLLNVPEYDFSWQTVYYFKQAKAIPKGTKIMVTGVFDNSTKNKFNPDPAKIVRFGEPTYDEMMIGWMDYTTDNERVRPATAMNQ
ncbi:MAG TPA: cytochrome c [Blastocatellia bacterium]|nr:cytochrome c [Blastocatellia bacterium]HMV85228.1 cytochrome c [Blastocatellia bacterium]HMX29649.1 cytochrome c [Blastocatellia bacterium]HMZ18343.1 cytochrome c [Blastocatellia bacterium]HNG28668.1 cytochrome c [Blastocatellia bacterium]